MIHEEGRRGAVLKVNAVSKPVHLDFSVWKIS